MKRNIPEEIANDLVKVSTIRRGRELVLVDNKPVGERNTKSLAKHYSEEWKQTVGHISIRTINACINAVRSDISDEAYRKLEELKGEEV